jgi:hypothetical protein
VVLAGGVLWTNALAYHDASVAPRARFTELASIGRRFSGQGPAFYNLSDEFAIHFLRSVAPVDPALGPPPPRPGLPPRPYTQARIPWDPDELDEHYLQSFPLLVLGRSPSSSRPPADYQLAYRGRYYDVWRRTAKPRVLEHVALGSGLEAAAALRCGAVMALARRARRERARLAYVLRQAVPTLVPTAAKRPNNWGLVDGDPYALIPRREPGAIVGAIQVQGAGRYQAWLQGSFSRQIQLWIDGRRVGSKAFELGPPDQVVPIGELDLRAGAHEVVIVVPEDNLAPGVERTNQTLGPLMLAPPSDIEQVRELDPAGARSLCGRSLDWIEIVR